MDRTQFITHKGKRVLLIDLSNCSASEIESIFRKLPDIVAVNPRASMLILSDFTGASFDAEAIRVMKETAVFNKAYVRKSAWVRNTKVRAASSEKIAEQVGGFSRREFPGFDSRADALLWLTKD
ncbi:MAG: hypothetical protein WCC95_04125 [Candidatus Sulfotelmatobacter sp.]